MSGIDGIAKRGLVHKDLHLISHPEYPSRPQIHTDLLWIGAYGRLTSNCDSDLRLSPNTVIPSDLEPRIAQRRGERDPRECLGRNLMRHGLRKQFRRLLSRAHSGWPGFGLDDDTFFSMLCAANPCKRQIVRMYSCLLGECQIGTRH